MPTDPLMDRMLTLEHALRDLLQACAPETNGEPSEGAEERLLVARDLCCLVLDENKTYEDARMLAESFAEARAAREPDEDAPKPRRKKPAEAR